MKKSELSIRYLVRKILKEDDAGEQQRGSQTETLKAGFGGYGAALKKGYERSLANYNGGEYQAVNDNAEKLALKNNDSIFENIIRHAHFIYDLEAMINAVEHRCDRIQNSVESGGTYGSGLKDALGIDISVADNLETQELLSLIDKFVTDIGAIVGYIVPIAKGGYSGGKQKIQKKLTKELKLGSTATETLENISKFVKIVESIPIKSAWEDLVKKEKKWFATERSKYNDFPLIDQASTILLPSLENNVTKIKPMLEEIYEIALSVERILSKIEETSIAQDEVDKEEAKEVE